MIPLKSLAQALPRSYVVTAMGADIYWLLSGCQPPSVTPPGPGIPMYVPPWALGPWPAAAAPRLRGIQGRRVS